MAREKVVPARRRLLDFLAAIAALSTGLVPTALLPTRHANAGWPWKWRHGKPAVGSIPPPRPVQ
jgi:hypothetical protein